MAVRMMEQAAARQRDRLIIVNQDRHARRRPARRAGADPGGVRQGLPAAQPARRRRHPGRRLLLQPRGHSDFGSVDAAHRALVEQVVEVDADFVERYLNEATSTPPSCTRRSSRRCARAT
jgi:elongation factor G